MNMTRLIVQFCLAILFICNFAYASDDYSSLTKNDLYIEPRSYIVDDNKVNKGIDSNDSALKQHDKVGYITLPHFPTAQDKPNCIVDRFKVQLNNTQQVKLVFENDVDSALIIMKDAARIDKKPVLEEYIVKNNGEQTPLVFKAYSCLEQREYVLEVHSFRNGAAVGKKLKYYLWIKIEPVTDLKTNNIKDTNDSFQKWGSKLLYNIKDKLMFLIIVITLIGIYFIVKLLRRRDSIMIERNEQREAKDEIIALSEIENNSEIIWGVSLIIICTFLSVIGVNIGALTELDQKIAGYVCAFLLLLTAFIIYIATNLIKSYIKMNNKYRLKKLALLMDYDKSVNKNIVEDTKNKSVTAASSSSNTSQP